MAGKGTVAVVSVRQCVQGLFQFAVFTYHDTLTGLFNRFSLEQRLDQAVAQARRNGTQLAVQFIDMDRFKLINDTLGHHVGDGLLVEVAHRLDGSVRESDIVARLGGDEFVVVLTGLKSRAHVEDMARQIVLNLARPYMVLDHELHTSSSIGIALFPDDGSEIEVLMKNADTAMYQAKKKGRNNYQFFNIAMVNAINEEVALERDLRQTLKRGALSLSYQPKVRADDGTISGVEALVRWQHPERGMVPPDIFIPIAEESGLIDELGRWVLDQACGQLRSWKREGIFLSMAVNLSARQFNNPTLIDELRRVMALHGIAENELELEITETDAMTDAEHATQVMRAIGELGVSLAIDDFGTGYSSLTYLKRFPIQTLKLDRSFVRDIGRDENDTAICKASISLAHTLGLRVVAEGIETEKQREFLVEHRCDTLQGYLFSPPMPADELNDLLRSLTPIKR